MTILLHFEVFAAQCKPRSSGAPVRADVQRKLHGLLRIPAQDRALDVQPSGHDSLGGHSKLELEVPYEREH